jgi:hypothetical protein
MIVWSDIPSLLTTLTALVSLSSDHGTYKATDICTNAGEVNGGMSGTTCSGPFERRFIRTSGASDGPWVIILSSN